MSPHPSIHKPDTNRPATVPRAIELVGLALLVFASDAFQIMLDTGRAGTTGSPRPGSSRSGRCRDRLRGIPYLGTDAPRPDRRAAHFRQPSRTVGTVAISLDYSAFFASIVLTPLWLQSIVGYNASQAGLAVAWVGVGAILLSPVAARPISRVRLLISGGIVWMAGVALMRASWTVDASYWTCALPQMLQGIGMPFFFIGLTTLAMASVDPRDTASAAGLMSFSRTLSGAVGTAMATLLWDSANQVAQAEAVGTLNDPAGAMAAMQARGLSVEQARGALDRLVEVPTATIGVTHVYMLSAVPLR